MAIKLVPAHFRVRCHHCQLEFEYDAEDVKMDSKSKPFVCCPVCAWPQEHDPNTEVHVPEPEKKDEKPQGPVDPSNPYATW